MERYRRDRLSALPSFSLSSKVIAMNVFELTRALVDIESITNNEGEVGNWLFDHLSALAARTGALSSAWMSSPAASTFRRLGRARVTLTSHMDVVPPFFPSHEDDGYIYGRGACDAKGIVAAMIGAPRS